MAAQSRQSWQDLQRYKKSYVEVAVPLRCFTNKKTIHWGKKIKIIIFRAFHYISIFLSSTWIAEGIVVGKNHIRRAGDRASHFCFWSSVRKWYYTSMYEISHIFGPYALVVPFADHIAIANTTRKNYFFHLQTT